MEKQSRESYQKLNDLIHGHDVVFLGTDSRESRWLPTAMCIAQDKMCLNVALGFDNFLVMRHGHGHHVEGSEGASSGVSTKNKTEQSKAALYRQS